MSKKRVLLDNKLAPIVTDLFEEAGIAIDIVQPKPGILETLVEHGGYNAVVVQSKTRLPLRVLEAAAKSLRVIGIVGDSLSNINLTDASNNGIIVKVSEYGNTHQVANLAKRLMVYMVSKSWKQGKGKGAKVFKRIGDIVPENCSGYELAYKTVGLIGCGNVAQVLAADIEPHCEDVIGYDNNPRAVYEQFHHRAPLERPVIDYCQLKHVLEKADIISIHTAGEKMVFSEDEIYVTGKRPYVVNTARRGKVGEAFLLEALRNKRLKGMAITVPIEQIESGKFSAEIQPFLALKNVVIAPTIGRPEAHKDNSRKLAQSVIDYLLHKDLSLAVNPVDASMGRKKTHYPIAVHRHQTSVPLHIVE